jgi:hypothetical protein
MFYLIILELKLKVRFHLEIDGEFVCVEEFDKIQIRQRINESYNQIQERKFGKDFTIKPKAMEISFENF